MSFLDEALAFIESEDWSNWSSRKDDREAEWSKAGGLAERLGFKWRRCGRDELYRAHTWDGRRALVHSPASLCHEVAHYQVASPGRRRMPDYGLGALFLAGPASTMTVGHDYAQREENYASALGIAWMHSLDMDWIAEFIDHSWVEDNADLLVGTIENLHAMGLMVDGAPVARLRTNSDRLKKPKRKRRKP